jgi:thioredoxin 1
MKEITSNEFINLIKEKTLIKFGATWCGPCKIQDSILDKLSLERTDIKIVSIDVDYNPALASEYEIQSVPTVVAFEKGLEIKRLVGVQSLDNLKKVFSINV